MSCAKREIAFLEHELEVARMYVAVELRRILEGSKPTAMRSATETYLGYWSDRIKKIEATIVLRGGKIT